MGIFHQSAAAVTLGLCLLCIAEMANGQLCPEVFFKERIGHLKFKLDYQNYYVDKSKVEDQPGRPIDFARRELNIFLPLIQNYSQEWFLTAKTGLMNIHTAAGLPIARRVIPRQLWDFRMGLGFRERLDNDWIWGANFSFGSASDKPFGTGDEILIDFLASVRIPHHNTNAIIVLFSFSNARDFLPYTPLPGIAYQYIPNKDFSLIGGFPYSFIRWKAGDRTTVTGSYIFPRTIHTRLSYKFLMDFDLITGFDWFNWRYMRSDRNDSKDRLFFFQKQVYGGFNWTLGEYLIFEVVGGYAFDRFFFEGEDFDDKSDRADIEDEPFLSISLNWRF